jgi:hypothetical protein
MSSDFDWLMRGKVYCPEQKANSRDFEKNFDGIHWNEESALTELTKRGNHKFAKHFTLKPDIQAQG